MVSVPGRSREDGPAHLTLVATEQAGELCLLEHEALGQTPRTAAPLVLEVDPARPRPRMPKRFPEHREIVALGPDPDDVPDAHPLGITAPETVRDAERLAPALAPTPEKALIPAARRQLIPDEGRDAARIGDRQPGRPVPARNALPPIAGQGRSSIPRTVGPGFAQADERGHDDWRPVSAAANVPTMA